MVTVPRRPRASVERFLTGTGSFVADVPMPGAAEITVVRSPIAHGRIRSISTERARGVPGVLAVLTAADLDPVPTIPIRSFERPGMERHLQPVLAHERVRFVGEPVAVVVAEDRATAEDAAASVEVDIEPSPVRAGVSLETGIDEVLCRWTARDGDVGAAFAEAAVVVAEDFTTHRHTAVPLETRGLAARWEDGGLSLWGPTKFLTFTQRTVAEWFGLDPAQVRIHRVDVGGMFGVRGELYPEDFLVPWASSIVGRSVRWIEDRQEHFSSVNHGREVRYRFEIAAAADGRLIAFRARAAVDMGAYARPAGGRVPLLVIEELPGPYQWRAFEATCDGVVTNKTPVGTVRGPSALESTFVRERAIDLVAGRLGLDPVDVRRASLIDGGGRPYVRRFGDEIHPQTFEPADYRGMFERFLSSTGHAQRREGAERRRARGEHAGIGLACFLAHSALGEEEHARVALREDGTIEVATRATEVGQGIDALLRRVVAETLEVEAERVRVRSGTTEGTPPGRGTFASRSAVFAGNAVRDACEHLLDQARTKAAKERGAEPEAFTLAPGGLRSDEELVPWPELAPLDADGVHIDGHPAFGFGAHLADLTLDPETGELDVRALALGYDCGRPLDPEGVVGQLVGATVQAFGGTTLEELVYDAEGQLLSGTLMDYLLPTSAEAPPVEALVLGAPSASNPLGAKGAGEAGVLGVAGALANAIADAAAMRDGGLTSLPLSPARVAAELAPARTDPSRDPPEE